MRIERPRSGDPSTLLAPAAPEADFRWLWMGGYAGMAWLLTQHMLTPLVPGSSFSLMSLPLALLAFALMVRPWREAPFYVLVHAIAGTILHLGVRYPAYNAVRVGLEIIEALLLVGMLRAYFVSRLTDPLFIAFYTVAVLMLTAASGFLLVTVAQLAPALGFEPSPVMVAQPGLAWRHWWLGHACSYLALAGPFAVLHTLRGSLARTLQDRDNCGVFLGLAGPLLLTSLIAFPVVDLSGLGLPSDVRQAGHLLPLPFAMAMAARFRAKGGSSAIIILSLVVILSVTGPSADANWAGLPPAAAPTQVLLLMTATACMVTGALSRQLLKATTDAIQAKEAKARFVAMLNHELRTPLNAILGFSELMRLQKFRDLDEAMGPIENIHASGQRLLAMIEGLLAQADQGASAFELHKHGLNLHQFVSGVVEELQSGLVAFRYPITIAIPEQLQIEADSRALQQIVLVLLSYPLRFVSPWTVITVSAHEAGTDTVLEVNSEGLSGAAPDERDKLELQLAKALALAHGARLGIVQSSRDKRLAQLTFFATRAAG